MGITKIKKPDSIEKMHSILLNEGIFIVESFLSNSQLNEIKRDVLETHKEIGEEYEFGSVYSLQNPLKLKKYSIQKDIFSKPWMKELFFQYNKKNLNGYFKSIYSTYDNKYEEGIGRNGYLHFDRNVALKYFLYLNDVSEENGAFYIQPNSHKLGKKLREKAWGKFIPTEKNNLIEKIIIRLFGKNFSDIKNRLEIDYEQYFEPKKLIPVEGKAGTLIVFDTDVFHLGGRIKKKGMERLVLRMHNYL